MKEETWQTQCARLGLPLTIGGTSIVLIVVSVFLLIKSVQTTTPIQFSSTKESSSSGRPHFIAVDIEGAVVKPGMYHLAEGSRVEEALGLAGGLSREADVVRIAQTINRASKLSDGAKLYFFTNADSPNNIVRGDVNTGGAFSQTTGMVNINMASHADLDGLPGVGPVTAQKIIGSRPYQVLTELVTKKAMSQSVFDTLKDRLTL